MSTWGEEKARKKLGNGNGSCSTVYDYDVFQSPCACRDVPFTCC